MCSALTKWENCSQLCASDRPQYSDSDYEYLICFLNTWFMSIRINFITTPSHTVYSWCVDMDADAIQIYCGNG